MRGGQRGGSAYIHYCALEDHQRFGGGQGKREKKGGALSRRDEEIAVLYLKCESSFSSTLVSSAAAAETGDGGSCESSLEEEVSAVFSVSATKADGARS